MKIVKIVLVSIFIILVFIILPRLFLPKVPSEFLVSLGSLRNILTTLTISGLAGAAFYTAKILTPKRSPVNLVAGIGFELVGYYLIFFFLGLGNPLSFGKVEKALPIEPGATLTFDFRIFVLVLLVVFAAKVVVATLKFYQARSKLDVSDTTRSEARSS